LLNQFMVCINGAVEIIISDGESEKKYMLSDMSEGLLVPPGYWCEQNYKNKDAILLVFCDKHYNESDYIRDYKLFKNFKEKKGEILGDGKIRLNLGCGGRPLPNYINVDMDSLDQIRERYPNQKFDDNLIVVQYDILSLPYSDDSVDEIRSEGLIEHLPFIDEPKFFKEIIRVLKPGGLLYLSTVDFELSTKQWLDAKDDWKDFYRDDNEAILRQHWFGTYTYEPINRWGYLTATLYGSQNGSGQFHTNCYSEKKLEAICKRMKLEIKSIEHFQWKGNRDHMLGLTAIKK